jgi:hypothetical protein
MGRSGAAGAWTFLADPGPDDSAPMTDDEWEEWDILQR